MNLTNLLHTLKWGLRVAIVGSVGFLFYELVYGDLGASPALKLNHELGELALKLLTLNIIFGILFAVWSDPPRWIRYWLRERRFWGVSAFIILVLHIFFYFVNEGFEGKAFTQLVTAVYLIFGTLAFLILAVLAATSNDYSLRKLGGKRWKKLHKLVYVAQLLLFGHILLIEKADLEEFGPWLGALALAQILRWAYNYYRSTRKQQVV